MGIFYNQKREINPHLDAEPIRKEIPYVVRYLELDNNLVIELVDNSYEEGKFYDTTRLVVQTNPLMMANHEVYNCAVSWYGSDDAKFLNKKTGKFENIDAETYKGVLAEVDINLLKKDKKYCAAVMKYLLDKERVEKYLEDGLKDVPELPCGKYVGGVRKFGDQYKKYFSQDIGLASHESDLMRTRRKELKEKQKQDREAIIAEKKAQIAALQREIAELEQSEELER